MTYLYIKIHEHFIICVFSCIFQSYFQLLSLASGALPPDPHRGSTRFHLTKFWLRPWLLQITVNSRDPV